ncbi:hypothetical protein ABBQ38_008454 [Trebouxia sp. C0009 RCD-2024]
MSSLLSCPQCCYTTTQVGHFNRHLKTHRRDVSTVTEICARCGRSFKVGGTGLRQHTTKFTCLAAPELQPFEHNGFEDGSYTLGLQKLRSLSSYLLGQHGFADPDVTRVALATDEIAGILLELLKAEKLPKKHSDELARFAKYGLHTEKPHSYTAMFVRQRPELHSQRLKTLEDIVTLLQNG